MYRSVLKFITETKLILCFWKHVLILELVNSYQNQWNEPRLVLTC